MELDTSSFMGSRLTASQRRDWRILSILAGALLVLISYCFPAFSSHITQATTHFTEQVTTSYYEGMVSGQHALQAKPPLKQDLDHVAIVVEPVTAHNGSGWGWAAQIVGRKSLLAKQVSYLICLLIPILSAILALAYVGISWSSDKGMPEGAIPPLINLSCLAPFALLLAWYHHFDFSGLLLGLDPQAFTPAFGFWGAMVGAVLVAIGAVAIRRETRKTVVSWWALVFFVALLIWLLTRFRPHPFLEIWLFITDGIVVTLRIVMTSFVLILVVSLLGGLGRISRSRIIYGITSLYVEVVRGIPLLVQLLFIWFALPQVFDVIGNLLISISPKLATQGQWFIDLRLSPFAAAVFGLTICYGAYGSEIFRAGISSIHHGQMEAARSLGMTYFQAMRYVILPQAVRVILPPVGNEFVALLKDSSLVSVLAVSDLTRRGREYMARTFLSFDTWIMVALCYLVLTLFSSRVVEYIETRNKFEG